MIFTETRLKGAYCIDIEPIEDERGFFARSWCGRELCELGLEANLCQCSISFNQKRGTLRGMHYQVMPFPEVKLVRCTMGKIYDVIVDMRKESDTYLQWIAVELSAQNRRMLYVPENFAHGFQTLEDNTEVFYQMSEFYHPECAKGYRWDDSAFAIEWPDDQRIISANDRSFSDYL